MSELKNVLDLMNEIENESSFITKIKIYFYRVYFTKIRYRKIFK